ncbi:MAG: 50S ribosomal protein L11 methyltransferase [Opitutaceae bacterium]|nr:50S ribosomal protein L11 methyltransferase [Opitutaceae bacterium]
MSLMQVKAEIGAASADAADQALLEAGFERWSILEDVPAKRAWVVGILPGEKEARDAWTEVQSAFQQAGIDDVSIPQFQNLADADWKESYKAHFHAWQFGELHWVPVWERENYSLPPGHSVLWLDPGLAFGTGNHETTRLCVERLVALAQERGITGRVVDAGCGSGILALSAALLGFADVTGFDNDPEAIRVSQENAAQNGLSERVRFFIADLATGLEGAPADLLLANIQADMLMRFAREFVGAVAPGGALVLSGILAAENAAVRTTFEALTPNWSINARTMGEWSDVLLVRPRT